MKSYVISYSTGYPCNCGKMVHPTKLFKGKDLNEAMDAFYHSFGDHRAYVCNLREQK